MSPSIRSTTESVSEHDQSALLTAIRSRPSPRSFLAVLLIRVVQIANDYGIYRVLSNFHGNFRKNLHRVLAPYKFPLKMLKMHQKTCFLVITLRKAWKTGLSNFFSVIRTALLLPIMVVVPPHYTNRATDRPTDWLPPRCTPSRATVPRSTSDGSGLVADCVILWISSDSRAVIM